MEIVEKYVLRNSNSRFLYFMQIPFYIEQKIGEINEFRLRLLGLTRSTLFVSLFLLTPGCSGSADWLAWLMKLVVFHLNKNTFAVGHYFPDTGN